MSNDQIPTKPTLPKRTVNFNIRLTPQEQIELTRRANGQPLATYIRNKCLDIFEPSSTKNSPKIDPRLNLQIARIGNNLNQIAKNLNASVNADNALNVFELGIQLQKIENELAQIRQHFTQHFTQQE